MLSILGLHVGSLQLLLFLNRGCSHQSKYFLELSLTLSLSRKLWLQASSVWGADAYSEQHHAINQADNTLLSCSLQCHWTNKKIFLVPRETSLVPGYLFLLGVIYIQIILLG